MWKASMGYIDGTGRQVSGSVGRSVMELLASVGRIVD